MFCELEFSDDNLLTSSCPNFEGHEGVKWELGFAFLGLGKWDLLYWDWDLITGNGMGNFKMGMGFLFFRSL